MSFEHPVAKARGLGSAKSGTQHWWRQRVTAAFLVPLLIWFAVAMASLMGADYATMVAWISSPLVAILLITLLGLGFYHLALGLQVIIEDYVHGEVAKVVGLLLSKAACFLLGLAGIFAVLSITFGGF